MELPKKQKSRSKRSVLASQNSSSAITSNGPSSSQRNMNISAGDFQQSKRKVPKSSTFSTSFTQKVKMNNILLAKRLEEHRKHSADYKSLEMSRKDLLMQLTMEIASREESNNRIYQYAKRLSTHMQSCCESLSQLVEEVEKTKNRDRPDVEAIKRSWKNTRSLKDSNMSKTQTVNPMVSGYMITQPRISLSRIDNGGTVLPHDGAIEVPELVRIDEEFDQDSSSPELLESESSHSEAESSHYESPESEFPESDIPESSRLYNLKEKPPQCFPLDEVPEGSSDDEQEVSLLSRSKRRRVNVKKSANIDQPQESQSAFYKRVQNEDAMEGTSRQRKPRRLPIRIKLVQNPPSSDDANLNCTSLSPRDMDETISNLSPIMNLPENELFPRMSSEFAEIMGITSLIKRESNLPRPQSDLLFQRMSTVKESIGSGFTDSTLNTIGLECMPTKILNVNLVPLSESLIAQASSKRTLVSERPTQMPNSRSNFSEKAGINSEQTQTLPTSSLTTPDISLGSLNQVTNTAKIPNLDNTKPRSAIMSSLELVPGSLVPNTARSSSEGFTCSQSNDYNTKVSSACYKSPHTHIKVPFNFASNSAPLVGHKPGLSRVEGASKSAETHVKMKKKMFKSHTTGPHKDVVENCITPKHVAGRMQKTNPGSANDMPYPRVLVDKLDTSVMTAMDQASNRTNKNEFLTPSNTREEHTKGTRSALRKIAPTNYKEPNLNIKMRREF